MKRNRRPMWAEVPEPRAALAPHDDCSDCLCTTEPASVGKERTGHASWRRRCHGEAAMRSKTGARDGGPGAAWALTCRRGPLCRCSRVPPDLGTALLRSCAPAHLRTARLRSCVLALPRTRAPVLLRSCAPAHVRVARLRSSTPASSALALLRKRAHAHLRPCAPALLRSCASAHLRSCARELLRSCAPCNGPPALLRSCVPAHKRTSALALLRTVHLRDANLRSRIPCTPASCALRLFAPCNLCTGHTATSVV